jgi:hypothetical protein
MANELESIRKVAEILSSEGWALKTNTPLPPVGIDSATGNLPSTESYLCVNPLVSRVLMTAHVGTAETSVTSHTLGVPPRSLWTQL